MSKPKRFSACSCPVAGDEKELELRFLSFSILMMVARAIFLLTPIVYAAAFQANDLYELLKDNLFYHLYYYLAFFDLLCFVEMFYVRKQFQTDPEISTTWGFFTTLLLAQAMTLNAMSVGTMVLFLIRNKGKIRLKEKLLSIKKGRLSVLINAAILLASLALFYYMLYIYVQTRT